MAVYLSKKAKKMVRDLDGGYRRKLAKLMKEIETFGPRVQHRKTYSTLLQRQYDHHCHIGWSVVVVWREVGDDVEVYYVGPRERAPY